MNATLFQPSMLGGPWARRMSPRRAWVDDLPWDEALGGDAGELEALRWAWTQTTYSEYAAAASFASITAASSFSRIIDGRALAESLVAITGALRIVGLIIVIGFSLAVLAVVVNAIRLAILARSDEIAIMRIVGASATWVRLPFILEGLAIGAAGALITLFIFGILSASIGAVMLNLFRVLPVQTSAILAGQVSLSVIAAGLGLGARGALLSLRGRLN